MAFAKGIAFVGILAGGCYGVCCGMEALCRIVGEDAFLYFVATPPSLFFTYLVGEGLSHG